MRILFIILSVVILTACQSRSGIDPLHAELHQHADLIEQLAEKRNLAWNDFLAEPLSFIVYERQGAALLVTHSTPIDGYSEQSGNRYLYPDGLPRLTGAFLLNYPAGDISVTAVSLGNTAQKTAELFFHEHFHSYQSERFSARPTHRAIDSDHFTNPQIRALLEMRRQLLSEAISKRNSSTNYLQDLLVLDQLLGMQLDSAALTHLHQLELIEGSAEYVETGITHDSVQAQQEKLQQRLQYPEHGVHSASDLRLYVYGSGGAIMYLLHQQQGVSPDVIMNQQNLHEVTTTLLGIEPHTQFSDETLSEVLSRYSIERWLVWALNESPAETFNLEQFNQLTPAAITFKLILTNADAANDLNINFSSGSGGMVQSANGGFLLRQPESISVHSKATSLVIEKAPSYLRTTSEPPGVEVTVRVDSLPELCGNGYDCTLETLKLDWQGIQFEHSASTSIEQQRDALIITIYE